jgi:hypothetical protein
VEAGDSSAGPDCGERGDEKSWGSFMALSHEW